MMVLLFHAAQLAMVAFDPYLSSRPLARRADVENCARQGELLDMAVVLHETCEEMEVVARSVGVHLDLQAPEECTWFGDPEDLRRIFFILLDNEIKYTPAAGKILMQPKKETSAEGRYAVILVRDTGIGISPDELPHFFDRFYRVSKDRSRKTGGSGSGLPIARYLAERRNGSIRVESSPGSGSTFHLVLPF